VLLLLSKSHDTFIELRRRVARPDLLGRLVDPRDCALVADTLSLGVTVAADNRAFAGFDAVAYERMLDRLAGMELAWVTCPDVVGDAVATLALWDRWAPEVESRGLRPAFVGQDGLDPAVIPSQAGCVFLGGSDAYKLGAGGRATAREARARGVALHIGRVNSVQRVAYAGRLGADSVDGTGFSRFTQRDLQWGLRACASWWLL
jgi:hypothetical protein